jgi:hypothetical protein
MVRFGWKPIDENDLPIGLYKGDCTITLEPGGQFELSGAALRDVHQILGETQAYHEALNTLARELSLSFLALGHQPKYPRQELPWMPKDRYRIMRAYMPKCGSLGLDMMQSTCAIQVTADFANEADMVKKFRVALALQPLLIRLLLKDTLVVTSAIAARFGAIPTLRAAAPYLSCSKKAWVSNDTPITCSMYRCTSFAAMVNISTPAVYPSAISWPVGYLPLPVSGPYSLIGRTT